MPLERRGRVTRHSTNTENACPMTHFASRRLKRPEKSIPNYPHRLGNIFPRTIHINEVKTRKCKKHVGLFTDSSGPDDNYGYNIEKLP